MTDKEITGMNLVNAIYYGRNQQINHFTEELAELIQAFAEENATHIADEIEKNNPAAKPLYEGMKKVVIAPPLTEIQKVKKANRR